MAQRVDALPKGGGAVVPLEAVGGGGGDLEHGGRLLVATDGNERLAALATVERLPRWGCTLSADRGCDAQNFVAELRERWIPSHVAQNTSGRHSAIAGRRTRHAGYALSRQTPKRIEKAFSWMKTTAGQARTRYRGLERVRSSFTFAAAGCNLIGLPKLLAGSG
jgi:hypothetical protein